MEAAGQVSSTAPNIIDARNRENQLAGPLVGQGDLKDSGVGVRPSLAQHRYSFESAVGQAGSTNFRSAAPYSATLSPIAEIRNMISPQLNATQTPADSNPRLLFIALQEYFEPSGARSANAINENNRNDPEPRCDRTN